MTHDPVNRPAHYVGDGLEAIDVIEDWRLGFHLGNAVKYILRAGKKGDAWQDLEKARWYVRRARALMPSGIRGRFDADEVAAAFGLRREIGDALHAIMTAVDNPRMWRVELDTAEALLREAIERDGR